MKKFLLFAAIAASAFSMNAQLTVLKSGTSALEALSLNLKQELVNPFQKSGL